MASNPTGATSCDYCMRPFPASDAGSMTLDEINLEVARLAEHLTSDWNEPMLEWLRQLRVARQAIIGDHVHE